MTHESSTQDPDGDHAPFLSVKALHIRRVWAWEVAIFSVHLFFLCVGRAASLLPELSFLSPPSEPQARPIWEGRADFPSNSLMLVSLTFSLS